MKLTKEGVLGVAAFLLLSAHVSAQLNVTTLGIQLKPIIESGIVGGTSFTITEGDLGADINPSTGLSFGMVIRKGLSENISLEFGLNRVTRRFNYNFIDRVTGFSEQLSYGYVNYEIPIKGLIFVQLGERTFLNNSLGPSLDFYASDVSSGDIELQQVTRRGQWAKVALEANVGMEYRSRDSGYFYLGTTYHNPFSNIARSSIRYRTITEERYVSFDLKGGYLTLDFKYFFHEVPEKK